MATTDSGVTAWEMTFYLDCSQDEADALFERMCDVACDCQDSEGRCVACGDRHELDDEGWPILCDDAKQCRNPCGGLHPARSVEEELRLYGTEDLVAELRRRDVARREEHA